jgi:hypothetical protein
MTIELVAYETHLWMVVATMCTMELHILGPPFDVDDRFAKKNTKLVEEKEYGPDFGAMDSNPRACTSR